MSALHRAIQSPKTAYKLVGQKVQKSLLSRPKSRYMRDLSLTEAVASFTNPNDLYRYAYHYFHHMLPANLRTHRQFFLKERRGFGEDAFHAMWWLIFREFKPKKVLEIGVYRGQVISLWSLIAQSLNYEVDIHAISPFTPAGDEVSEYLKDIDYLKDVQGTFDYFGLKQPNYVVALSTDPVALQHIASGQWDLIYIDGNHDYDVVLADYRACYSALAKGGLLIFDDSALDTDYKATRFSTAGHPGPSKVVQQYVRKEMEFVGAIGHNTIFRKK